MLDRLDYVESLIKSSENGWLYLNEEEAYCSKCRKQIECKESEVFDV